MSFSRGNWRCFLKTVLSGLTVFFQEDVEAGETCAFTRPLSWILTFAKIACSAQLEVAPALHQVLPLWWLFPPCWEYLKMLTELSYPPLSQHSSPCQIRTPNPVLSIPLAFPSTLLLIPCHILFCEAISLLRPAPFPWGSCEWQTSSVQHPNTNRNPLCFWQASCPSPSTCCIQAVQVPQWAQLPPICSGLHGKARPTSIAWTNRQHTWDIANKTALQEETAGKLPWDAGGLDYNS